MNRATQHRSRLWPLCRIYFRRLRLVVWVTVLALLGALCYLNQVGLPTFAKRPLLEKLRLRGIDLQFSRLRLRFDQGIVADNVHIDRPGDPLTPQLKAEEGVVGISLRSLFKLQLQVDALGIRKGQLIWPVADTNRASRQLSIENIQARLRFLPEDQWSLDQLTASFGGARFELSGSLAHASAVRNWSVLRSQPSAPVETTDRVRDVADFIERIHFEVPPEFRMQLQGDAQDPQSLNVRLDVTAPGADTAWGTLAGGQLKLRLVPASTNRTASAELAVKADSTKMSFAQASKFQLTLRAASFKGLTDLVNAPLSVTGAPPGTMLALRGLAMVSDAHLSAAARETHAPWGVATNLRLNLDMAADPHQTNTVDAELAMEAGAIATKWGTGTNAHFAAKWVHDLTNGLPIAGNAQFQSDAASCDYGKAGHVNLVASMARRLESPIDPPPLPSPRWWTNLAPLILDLGVHVGDVSSHGLQARAFDCAAHWQAPDLTLTNIAARFEPGSVDAGVALNICSRVLSFHLASDADPHQFASLLSEPTRRILDQLTWPKPPQFLAEGELVLPVWTNRQPDWASEVQPTLRLNGQVNLTSGGAYHGISALTAASHFSYSNLTWRLPDLLVTTSEGNIQARHEANERTGQMYWNLRSSIDVNRARPLLGNDALSALDLFAFTVPPRIEAEFWACSNNVERIGLKAHVFATNFVFRGESVASVETDLQYTNNFLQFTKPRLRRPRGEEMTAEGLGVEFTTQRMYLTNGFSTADPGAVTRAIGPAIAQAMQPYRFDTPPVVHAHGVIPLQGEEDADLYFLIQGGPFHWWKFQLPTVAGNVHWFGEHVTLDNVGADFYEGKATGSARFDFHPGSDTDFSFSLKATDAQLQKLMSDLSSRTNRLEGRLSGNLVITNASTGDWRRTQGKGDLVLRDGLIWDCPVFGVFSGVLNGIAPGLGNSRANAATCTFEITNGVIHSDNLEIRSPTLRLEYRGTVDLEGQLNARVEAEFMRNMWLVGPLVSTVFWPITKVLEYKVGGTLEKPKTQPLYLLPRILMIPFQPLRSLKESEPETTSNPQTNAPPPAPH